MHAAHDVEWTSQPSRPSSSCEIAVATPHRLEAKSPSRASSRAPSTVVDQTAVHTAPINVWLYTFVLTIILFTITAYNNLGPFMVQYAKDNFGIGADEAIAMQILGKVVQLVATPFVALLADLRGAGFTCAIGGMFCVVLAVPMMAAAYLGGVAVAWVFVGILSPAVATLWIQNAPLLVIPLYPRFTRGRFIGVVFGISTGAVGFFPLAMHQVQSNPYFSGGILAAIALVALIGILWIMRMVSIGAIAVFLRPELY